MHRKILWALAITAVALLAGACATPTPETIVEQVVVTEIVEVEGETTTVEVEVTTVPGRCAPADVADIETIQIGATAPLSAPGSVTGGIAMQIAFRFAEDDINAAGGVLGKPVNVILNDTEGLPERGTAVMERLITQDCVVAVVGEYHSAVGLTMKEVANKYHVPVIFAETYSDDITSVGYPEVFRIAPTSTFTAQMDGKWLTDVGDYNGDGEMFVIIVAENTGYGQGQVDKADKWFPEYGLTHETFFADLPTQDFSSVVTRINALDTVPDAILIKVTGETSYNLQQQLYEGGIDISKTMVVANQVALDSAKYWQNVPDGNFAVVPRIGPWYSSASQTGLDFFERYANATGGRVAEAYAFEAYDSLMLMADAINRAGSLDPDAIIAALEETSLDSVLGTISFPYGSGNTPEDAGQPAYMWHQWPEVPLLFLQYTEAGQSETEVEVIWPAAYRTSDGPVVRP